MNTQTTAPSEESTGSLDLNGAAAEFAAAFERPNQPQEAEPAPQESAAAAAPQEAPAESEDAAPQARPEADDPTVTVKIDGKEVEVKLSELKNGYQRQADYTRKTQQVAEDRRAVAAAQDDARQRSELAATQLARAQAALEFSIAEQQKTDWQGLIESNPLEYLKQQHLFQQRQAQLAQVAQAQQQLQARYAADQRKALESHLVENQARLLDKLPEWKDEAKAKADKSALRDYLKGEGYSDADINSVADARAVVMARKAMLYDQMVSKAQAAAKKVTQAPTKVLNPGTEPAAPLDRRSEAFKRLSKTGKVEDAAALFRARM